MEVSKTIKLATGNIMPLLGLGTWQQPPLPPLNIVKEAVKTAINSGYRLIDTSEAYQNENAIGDAIAECMEEGTITRNDIFVTTKLWLTHRHSNMVEACLRTSLKQLRLEFVDLYLVHMLTGFTDGMAAHDPVPVEETWKGMEGVFNLGLAKAIGVANYSLKQMERIEKCATVQPHSVQVGNIGLPLVMVECQLYWPQFELHKSCVEREMNITAFSCLGSPGRDRKKFGDAPNALEDENIVSLAAKYGKSPAQVILRWLTQRGITVIPKSITAKRIEENGDIWDFSLTDAEVATLNDTKHRQRIFMQDFMKGHPEYSIADERN